MLLFLMTCCVVKRIVSPKSFVPCVCNISIMEYEYEYSIIDYMEMVRMLDRCHDNAYEACVRFFILFSDVPPPTPQKMLAARQWLIDYGPPDLDQLFMELEFKKSSMKMSHVRQKRSMPQETPNKRRKETILPTQNNQNGSADMETD